MSKRKALKNEQVQAVDRQRQALELRKLGCSYATIARRLNYAAACGAWQAVRRGMQTTLQEPADELRTLELERLDRMHEAIWPKAIAGHLRSVDAVLSIMQRRARLLGLDAPKRHRVAAEIPLATFAEQAAAMAGLDAASLLAEAEQILETFSSREKEHE